MTFSAPVTTVSVASPEAQPSVLISGGACRSVNNVSPGGSYQSEVLNARSTSRPGTVGFGGCSDLCAWQNRGNGAGVVMSTRVMGTHAGAETGRRDVIRPGASGGMAESGVVEPSVTQHSVGGFNTDISNMVGVTGNSNTGGWLVSVECVTWVMSLQM